MSDEKMYSSVQMVFLSNLIESKGIWDLLDALRLLKERGCQYSCVIIGGETVEISAARLYQEIAQKGLSTIVVYKGQLFGKEKEMMLASSDLFVFPTYYPNECFPLVLLEAMQHGLPCITTSEGAICDIVENGVTGLICKKKNPIDLADKVEMLLSDEALRRRMGQNGRKRYEKYFTLEHFEHNMTEILRQLTC